MNVETRPPSVEEHRLAFIEVSFLLSIFATTVHDMMGGATAPVGRVAGRQAAAKLPVHLPEPTPAAVLEVVKEQLKPAFAIEGRAQGRVISRAAGGLPEERGKDRCRRSRRPGVSSRADHRRGSAGGRGRPPRLAGGRQDRQPDRCRRRHPLAEGGYPSRVRRRGAHSGACRPGSAACRAVEMRPVWLSATVEAGRS